MRASPSCPFGEEDLVCTHAVSQMRKLPATYSRRGRMLHSTRNGAIALFSFHLCTRYWEAGPLQVESISPTYLTVLYEGTRQRIWFRRCLDSRCSYFIERGAERPVDCTAADTIIFFKSDVLLYSTEETSSASLRVRVVCSLALGSAREGDRVIGWGLGGYVRASERSHPNAAAVQKRYNMEGKNGCQSLAGFRRLLIVPAAFQERREKREGETYCTHCMLRSCESGNKQASSTHSLFLFVVFGILASCCSAQLPRSVL